MRSHYKDQLVHGDGETLAVCSETRKAQNVSTMWANLLFCSFQSFTELLLTRRSSYFGRLCRAADGQFNFSEKPNASVFCVIGSGIRGS